MEKITLPPEALNQEPSTKTPDIDIDRLSTTLETAWREQGKELFPCATDGCTHLVLKTGETCWDCQMKALNVSHEKFERDAAERKKKFAKKQAEIQRNYEESVRKINESSARRMKEIEETSENIATGVLIGAGIVLLGTVGYLALKK